MNTIVLLVGEDIKKYHDLVVKPSNVGKAFSSVNTIVLLVGEEIKKPSFNGDTV